MKRRNGECPKLRRPVKRNKITDGIYGSTLVYLKFFMLWALVLLADFLLEFRFEFLWPFWLLLRSVYDSYKYQGLAFSVFFVSIALTSDMICYFFIPVQWLFFAASTYVWVQYVWHTEKGICLPTVMLWLLFAYMEAAVRLKDLRHVPFHLDLCRPFAAHCIGYPVVTLGFGFKSYVSYRLRQRRQREVQKENEFYMNLLAQALPIESSNNHLTSNDKLKNESSNSNGVQHMSCSNSKQTSRKSQDKSNSETYANGSAAHHPDIDYTEKIKEGDETEVLEKDKSTASTGNSSSGNSSNKKRSLGGGGVGGRDSRKNQKNQGRGSSFEVTGNSDPQRDEYSLRLEFEVKRLKSELSVSRQNEGDLKSQLSAAVSSEQRARAELATLYHVNHDLQSKVSSLNALRCSEKAGLEKRLADERRGRTSAESALKAAKAREATLRAQAQQQQQGAGLRTGGGGGQQQQGGGSQSAVGSVLTGGSTGCSGAAAPPGGCSESCRGKRRELELEVKALRREVKAKEEKAALLDRELKSLTEYKESRADSEVLLAAVTALQDKNSHLESSLSAETRIKMDLFSALGDAKRHVEISNNVIRVQEREIEELKSKMAQVLAVMPHSEFSPLGLSGGGGGAGGGPSCTSPAAVGSSSTGGAGGSASSQSHFLSSPESNLDPNASVYTPKQQGHLTSEA